MREHTKAIRRNSLPTGLVSATAATAGIGKAEAAENPYGDSTNPNPEMTLDLERTALVVIDPHPDFLCPKEQTWSTTAGRAKGQNTVRNIARLFEASKDAGLAVAISLTRKGLRGSCADFMPELRHYIEDGKTIISAPNKVYSPRVNSLGRQLRKQCVEQIILAGLIANLPIESHLRDFFEQGFDVAVVRDAVAGPKLPEGPGYLSTLVNFRRIANTLWTTEEAVRRLG